jgi:glycosyltransferase involved in cell wall biosynthesis
MCGLPWQGGGPRGEATCTGGRPKPLQLLQSTRSKRRYGGCMTVRVLHCPTDTGGNAWTLARAERALGLDSAVMVFGSSWLQYPADVDLRLPELSRPGRAVAVARAFYHAVHDYDVIHFNFGESLLPRSSLVPWLRHVDLPLLRALRKVIVVTYQGCDVRQRGFCTRHFPFSACDATECGVCTPEVDADRARRAAIFDRYADSIFALNPDLLRVLPQRAEFLPYATIDPRSWTPVRSRPRTDGIFRILHAPTSRSIKGTRYLVAAVEGLRETHPGIELDLVEGRPHAEVRALYESADVVVDQLLIGWYGGFAVEAMALGKPVVCYLREEDVRLIPSPMRHDIPLLNATPHTLAGVLSALASDPAVLEVAGRRSREYVERWHDPARVAQRTKAVYEHWLKAKRLR